MINKKELLEILEDLTEVADLFISKIRKRFGNELITMDADTLFSEACSYHRGLMIEENKKGSIKKDIEKKNKPTEKQLAFFRKTNYDGKIPETKEEATQIIKNYLEGLKEK